jgi:hypothetical protein
MTDMLSLLSPGRRRRVARRSAFSVLALFAASSVVLASLGSASASLSSAFELDGNVVDNGAALPSAPDWGRAASGNTTNSIFTVDGTGTGVKRAPLPAGFFDAGFVRDFKPGSTADSSTFTNGAKDTGNISTGSANWSCVKANNVTNKGDIQNAYTAVYNDTSFTPAHLVLYFGMEKNTANGDNNMGVWFLQDGSVACDPGTGAGTSFTGNHTDGDVLLVAAFTNGGGTPAISAYKWVGGAGGSLSTTAIATGSACTASATICAITNTATNNPPSGTVTTPWQTVNGSVQGTALGANQFYEGAVDLTANHLDQNSSGAPICINKFVFDTRSSQTIGASLYDYAEGSVQTCGTSSITTALHRQIGASPDPATDPSLAPPNDAVTLPANVYDTASVTPGLGSTAGGTVRYALYTDSSCSQVSTNPAFDPPGSATVTIDASGTIPPSPTLTFTQPGTYYWQATYTPAANSRDTGSTSTCSTEPLRVGPRQPAIATTPSPTVQVGGSPAATINDVATITGGFFPAGGIAVGNVTFKLYGPFPTGATITADSCTAGNLLATSTNAGSRVTDTTATATSNSFTPTSAGRYQWTARYAGNAQNLAAPADVNGTPTFTSCGDTSEQVVVSPQTPTLATTMSLTDRVVVSGVAGAGSPAGNAVFQLYRSTDCSGTKVYDSGSVTLAADANGIMRARTPDATEVAAGSYSWKVTFTPDPGNVNYTAASTTCTAAQSDEQATFGYAGTSPAS